MKNKQKQKAHIIKNTAFMLGCALKCAPLSLFIIYFSYIAENVYYAVVINVMFLETALSMIENNGSFQDFAIRMGIIILGKLLVDLIGYIDVYTVRIKFEIKCESYINSLIFKKEYIANGLTHRTDCLNLSGNVNKMPETIYRLVATKTNSKKQSIG